MIHKEKQMRAKTLRKLDVNHNVFVGQVDFGYLGILILMFKKWNIWKVN